MIIEFLGGRAGEERGVHRDLIGRVHLLHPQTGNDAREVGSQSVFELFAMALPGLWEPRCSKSAYRFPPVNAGGRTVAAGRQLAKRSRAVSGRIASTAPA
jgi:hypothetical protein